MRKPKFTLKLPVLNQWTEVSKIGCPVSMNIFAKKLREVPSIVPIKAKAIQCAKLPIFFPNNMSSKKDKRGKNKLNNAIVV
jgi:hypothetical protein